MLLRWLLGAPKVLLGYWDSRDLSYHARSGLDPKLPAFKRWSVRLKSDVDPARAADVLPVHNYSVFLEDSLGFMPEELIFHTQNAGQAQAVHEQYERELRSRGSGEFWHSMIRNRRLDFFHVAPPIEELPEESEVDEEAFREMFRRDSQT